MPENSEKILKAKERVDKALEDLKDVTLSGTVAQGDSMIALREVFDIMGNVSLRLAALADRV